MPPPGVHRCSYLFADDLEMEIYFRKSSSVGNPSTRAVAFSVAWFATCAWAKFVSAVARSAPTSVFSCWLKFNLPALVVRPQQQKAFFRLPRLHPLVRCFNPVVHRIPHQVRQRILDRLNNRLVQLRLFPF